VKLAVNPTHAVATHYSE